MVSADCTALRSLIPRNAALAPRVQAAAQPDMTGSSSVPNKRLGDQLDLFSEIGKGGFATVWSARLSSDGSNVAVKQMHDPFRSQRDARRTFCELSIQQAAAHANILPLITVYAEEARPDVFVVLPLMETDLNSALRRGRVKSELQKHFVSFQLLCALKYLHSGGVVHLDLKTDNLLLSDQCELKLCDFGLARRLDAADSACAASSVGSLWTRSPELLAQRRPTSSADVWSAACVLAEVYRGGRPIFMGANDKMQLARIVEAIGEPSAEDAAECGVSQEDISEANSKASTFPRRTLHRLLQGVSADVCSLISAMLRFSPRKRPSIADALAHPSLRAFISDDERRGAYAAASTASATAFDFPLQGGSRAARGDYKQHLFERMIKLVSCFEIAASTRQTGVVEDASADTYPADSFSPENEPMAA